MNCPLAHVPLSKLEQVNTFNTCGEWNRTSFSEHEQRRYLGLQKLFDLPFDIPVGSHQFGLC
jgi:hypothetical protein